MTELSSGMVTSLADRRAALAQASETISAAAGKVQHALGDAAAAVSHFSAHARDAYGRARDNARKVADTVDPFVHERPYRAIGLAIGVGLLIGLVMASRGPRVIYLRDND